MEQEIATEKNWDSWVEAAHANLVARKMDHFTKTLVFDMSCNEAEVESFSGPGPWDRSVVEVDIAGPTLSKCLSFLCEETGNNELATNVKEREKMLLFFTNDYLCLSAHPAVRKAASSAALAHGLGPRASAVACGNTSYHDGLASTLAALTKKEDCIIFASGFNANAAFLTSVGSICSLLSTNTKPSIHERIAIFSDAFNHASIVDGIRLAERQGEAQLFVYRHRNMSHLEHLITNCPMEKKLVITDSLFSMDGDFAPLPQLAALRKKHGFLLAIDDAHGTLVCGENGGGVAEMYGCEKDIDVYIGCMSKAVGTIGGFITCSKNWKQLIESRGRAFIYTTSLPVPIVAATQAALIVARKEKWRKEAVWERVNEFRKLTGLNVDSPIISIVLGDEKSARAACRHLLMLGFYILSILPPIVPPNSCRLRITLCSAHTTEDIKRLVAVLLPLLKPSLTAVPKL